MMGFAIAQPILRIYFANFVGMRRKLFPELATGYRNWLENGSQAGIERIAGKGREHWHDLACEMLDLHAHLGDAAGGRIEQLIESDAALM